jgi:putative transposase
VVLMIDGIHFGGQVLVVALGIAEGGEKHVLGVWQGATENTTVVTIRPCDRDGHRSSLV